MKKRKTWKIIFIVVFFVAVLSGIYIYQKKYQSQDFLEKTKKEIWDNLPEIFSGEPKEVRELRKKQTASSDKVRQEYYFNLLNEEEKKGYREILEGVRAREKEFYLTIYEDAVVNKVYHAVLMDHPELFWIHNRKQVYKTTFSNGNYCMFSPGYSYTAEEIKEIQQTAEDACREVEAMIPEGADDYEKARTVYTYLIDTASYQESEDDQSMAGIFWKKQAVCAGYAGAAQYLLEYLDVPCIYVEGKTAGSTEGHAWNIITLEGEYYYFDATNGDQPEFLEGDAVQLAEHKTILYDYLCPFPEEYEMTYTPSEKFEVPKCTATAKNFYVLNQGCFDEYDYQEILAYCQMRLNNGAAVVRFKFSDQEAFELAKADWIQGNAIQEVARHYMTLYNMNQVEYHYGILENMKTIYYMF